MYVHTYIHTIAGSLVDERRRVSISYVSGSSRVHMITCLAREWNGDGYVFVYVCTYVYDGAC